jgi:hypothetical protein
MATRASFFGKKLKDLNPMALLEPQTFLLRARQQMNRYSAAYIRTGSFMPVVHATLFFGSTGMMFQYYVRGRTSSSSCGFYSLFFVGVTDRRCVLVVCVCVCVC